MASAPTGQAPVTEQVAGAVPCPAYFRLAGGLAPKRSLRPEPPHFVQLPHRSRLLPQLRALPSHLRQRALGHMCRLSRQPTTQITASTSRNSTDDMGDSLQTGHRGRDAD
jgi:hypothetical protein